MKLMNTSNLNGEADRLKSEIEVGKSVVESARNKYAAELGDGEAIKQMLKIAASSSKRYKIPRKVRKHGVFKALVEKIMLLFGL